MTVQTTINIIISQSVHIWGSASLLAVGLNPWNSL